MKLSRLFFITIFLIIFLSIGAINATDINDVGLTDDYSDILDYNSSTLSENLGGADSSVESIGLSENLGESGLSVESIGLSESLESNILALNSLESNRLTEDSNSSGIYIDDDNYGQYFESDESSSTYGHLLHNSSINGGDSIKLGDLSEKLFVIDKSLNIASNDTNNILTNVKFIINENASKSNISGLSFKNTDTKFTVAINQSSDISINNLNIVVNMENSNLDLSFPILIIGGDNNYIFNNSIKLYNSSEVDLDSYLTDYYGIRLDNSDLTGEILSSGVKSKSSTNTVIKNNKITINSPNRAYGVYLSESINTLVFNNTFDLSDGMVYIIRADLTENNTIVENVLLADADAAFAYAASNVFNDNLSANYIWINGVNATGLNSFDGISLNQSGIIYRGISSNINIDSNYIVCEYLAGGDYGVSLEIDNSSNNVIISNNYILSDNGNKCGNDAVYLYETLNEVVNNITISSNTPESFKKSTKFEYESNVQYALNNNSYVSVVFNVTLKDVDGNILANKTVNFLFADVSYEIATDNKGIAKISLNLSNNDTIAFSFFGDDRYEGTLAYSNIYLYNEIPIFKINTEFLFTNITSITNISLNGLNTTGELFNVTLKDMNSNILSNKTIEFNFNGENFTVLTDSKGIAQLPIAYSYGTFGSISFKFAGDDYYNSNTEYAFINISKKTSDIVFSNMTTTAIYVARSGKYFYAQLTDSDGKALSNKTVQIGFNAATYTRTTDENGSFRLQVNLKVAGGYTFAIAFLGDDEYNGSFGVAKITVNKAKTKLTNVKSKYTYKSTAKTKSLQAKLSLSNGTVISKKTVTFTVNGKTYSATTNSKGVATVKVSITAKKTYKYTVKFATTNQLVASSTTGTLIIS